MYMISELLSPVHIELLSTFVKIKNINSFSNSSEIIVHHIFFNINKFTTEMERQIFRNEISAIIYSTT